MKHLRRYNENSEVDKFDINFAIAKIKESFSDDEVSGMFDGEILEWVDGDWADEYESEYDWYVDHNNGEAQDVIIEKMISWFRKEYNKTLNMDDYSELFDAIKGEYSVLSY